MTTFSLLTPPSPAAIAVIRLVGPSAQTILAQLTATLPLPGKFRRAPLTHNTQPLDDALLLCLAPHHYELHLHGGPAVVEVTLAALAELGATKEESGARSQEQGEMLSAPVENQKSKIENEIALTLPRAQTPLTVRLLANQSTTGLHAWATSAFQKLQSDPTALNWKFHSHVQFLLDRSASLAHLLTPPKIALIGPPNAGKSTLANAFLGRPLSITSPTPGTTRDWVDAPATLLAPNGAQLVITLIDTAGIRLTTDPIESESIRRTHHQAATAHALLIVLDTSQPLDATTQNYLATLAANSNTPPTLIALNKSDLMTKEPGVRSKEQGESIENPPPSQSSVLSPQHFPFPTLPVSALTHHNLETLSSALIDLFALTHINPHELFAFTPAQISILQKLSMTSDHPTALALLTHLLQ